MDLSSSAAKNFSQLVLVAVQPGLHSYLTVTVGGVTVFCLYLIHKFNLSKPR